MTDKYLKRKDEAYNNYIEVVKRFLNGDLKPSISLRYIYDTQDMKDTQMMHMI